MTRARCVGLRARQYGLSLYVATVLASACAVSPAPRSRRVDALVQLYTPLMTLGEDEASVATRLPALGADTDSVVPVLASLDGYALARVHFSGNLLASLRSTLSVPMHRHGRVVNEIVLSSNDRTAPSRAIARINAIFDAQPEEGCITTPDPSEIRILVWRAQTRGAAAVMIPVGIASPRPWQSTLLFARGALDLGNFAPWYEPRLCPDRWMEEELTAIHAALPKGFRFAEPRQDTAASQTCMSAFELPEVHRLCRPFEYEVGQSATVHTTPRHRRFAP